MKFWSRNFFLQCIKFSFLPTIKVLLDVSAEEKYKAMAFKQFFLLEKNSKNIIYIYIILSHYIIISAPQPVLSRMTTSNGTEQIKMWCHITKGYYCIKIELSTLHFKIISLFNPLYQ